jgi:AcrR family transcriptional regulator
VSTSVRQDTIQWRLRSVPAPAPELSREREEALTDRQREILSELGRIFEDGFAGFTMAELAGRLNCSLRTLYELAPTRDELVLTVVDRNLRSVGRAAHDAIDPHAPPLDALRSYLRAATDAVAAVAEPFARDLAAVPAAQQLQDAHNDYLVAVARSLLDLAVEEGDVAEVDTAAVARTMAGLGRDLSRPDVMVTLASSPKEAADALLDILLRGLHPPVADPPGGTRT